MFNTEPELLHNSSQFIWIKIHLLTYFSTLENIKNLNIDLCNSHYSHVLNLFSHSAVRLRESLLLNVWSGHSLSEGCSLALCTSPAQPVPALPLPYPYD